MERLFFMFFSLLGLVYSLMARSISLFPGGPGNRVTLKPTACMALLTLPFAE